MKIYVTGASGFVGRTLCERVDADGHTSIAVDRDVDVTDPQALATSLDRHRPDAIVHLAAISSVPQSNAEPDLCHRVNVEGTRNLLDAAKRTCPSARILLVGSTDQYGATEPREKGFDEATPLAPRSVYAKTKAAAESLGNAAAAEGRDVVRIRATNHSGRGQADHFVVSSFAHQLADIRHGRAEPILHVGNLDSVRDFLHVDDVIEAYRKLLDPSVPADVYNVSSGEPVSIREILERLIEISGVHPEVETDPDRFRPTDWSVADSGRLRAATGWRPRRSLDDLLREIYDDWVSREAS